MLTALLALLISAQAAPLPLTAQWRDLPRSWHDGVDAVAYDERTDVTWLFRGTKVVRMQGDRIDPGYPRPTVDVLDVPLAWNGRVDAAMMRRGELHLFKENATVALNVGGRPMRRAQPPTPVVIVNPPRVAVPRAPARPSCDALAMLSLDLDTWMRAQNSAFGAGLFVGQEEKDRLRADGGIARERAMACGCDPAFATAGAVQSSVAENLPDRDDVTAVVGRLLTDARACLPR